MFAWEWWNGPVDGRGVPFVSIEVERGLVRVMAGDNDYEVWGSLEVYPFIAEIIAEKLLEAASIAREYE